MLVGDIIFGVSTAPGEQGSPRRANGGPRVATGGHGVGSVLILLDQAIETFECFTMFE